MIVILGAGPCGLGAGFRLRSLGFEDFAIYEAQNYVGGLATSFKDPAGFTWDIGGHVQFSHYSDFDRVMDLALPDGWLVHQRESWVWMKERFIPYPFQLNLWRLPLSDQEKCLKGLRQLQKMPPSSPENFREWIRASFGEGIAEIFMGPYNWKVWAYDLQKMDFHWIGERVAKVDLARVERNLQEKRDDVSWGPNATFRYPKRGGTGAIWKAVAEQVGMEKIHLQKRAIKIEPKTRQIYFEDGTSLTYTHLLSCLPIDQTYKLAGLGSPPKLLSSDSHIVGLGLRGKMPSELKTKCWIYFPENNCPFYRVTVFSNYSPENVPDPEVHWSLMCETSESPEKPVNTTNLISETIEGLRKTQMLPVDTEIVSQWHFTARPGYPTPFLGRDSIITDLLNQLESFGIYSRGRFGLWKYEVSNQDHTFMQGFEWVNRILFGEPETTAFFPEKINQGEKIPLHPRTSIS